MPAAGETLNARSFHRGPGGKGLNQAVAAARTGADIRFIAAVGLDAVAGIIRDALNAEDIDATSLIERPAESDVSAIIVGSGGENMIVTAAARAESVSVQDIEPVLSLTEEDALLVQGNLAPEPTLFAARRARGAGAKVVFNAAPYRDWCRAMIEDTDVLILNAVEAERWTHANDPEHAIQRLAAPLTIVTRGSHGCLLRIRGNEVLEFSAPRLAAEDTSGAGDVFAGVFTAEWLLTGNPEQAVGLALLAASDSVTRHGTFASIPTRRKISQLRVNLQ